MKALSIIIFLIVLISTELKAETEWHKTIVSEDAEAFYYVGISEKNSSLKEAMNESYLEALKEAIRHSFGFRQKYSENSQSTLKDIKIFGQMSLEAPEVKFTGITPFQEKIVESKNGEFIVYRQIKYLKSEREKEIARQKILEQGSEQTQRVQGGQGILGSVKIKTNPEGALITLTKREGDFQIQATSNALFEIPIGRYRANFHKENYLPKSEEIIVAGNPSTFSFDLEVGKGKVDISVSPSDALLYLNNIPLQSKSNELPVGVDYTLRIEHPDYYPEERSFSPWFNEEVKVDVNLRSRPGRITVTGNPEGAEVYLGEMYLGITPILKKEIPASNNFIRIKRSGFEEHREYIKVLPNKDNPPITYVLNKEEMNRPSKKEKKILSEASISSDPSYKGGNATFTYNPAVMEGGNSVFYQVPIGFNIFSSSQNFSFGIDWRATFETEYINNVEYEKTYQVISFNTRFYLARNSFFSLGLGPEYNYRSLKIEPTYQTVQNKPVEVTDSSFGANAHLMIPVSYKAESSWGLMVDYRIMDFNNSNLNSASLGVYLEF